jgi:hypothetical protein
MGGSKNVFQGLRQTALLSTEGKKLTTYWSIQNLYKTFGIRTYSAQLEQNTA